MEFLDVLQDSPALLVRDCAALLGLCVGSFLNVVIHRLPKMMEAQWRAECAALNGAEPPPPEAVQPACTPRVALPVVRRADHRRAEHPGGELAAAARQVRGSCKAPISARYPAGGARSAGALAGCLAWRFGYSAALVGALVFAWALLALTFIDLDTQLLPDDITLPLLWLGLLVEPDRHLHRPALGGAGRDRRLPRPLVVYWGFRLHREEGGHGLRRLQAARRDRRVDRLAGAAVRDRRLRGPGRGDRRRSRYGCREERPRYAHPLRPLPRAGRHRRACSGGARPSLAWLGHFPA